MFRDEDGPARNQTPARVRTNCGEEESLGRPAGQAESRGRERERERETERPLVISSSSAAAPNNSLTAARRRRRRRRLMHSKMPIETADRADVAIFIAVKREAECLSIHTENCG